MYIVVCSFAIVVPQTKKRHELDGPNWSLYNNNANGCELSYSVILWDLIKYNW